MKNILIIGLSIELEKKRIKNMYLRILPPDGRIHITAPYRMKEEEIRGFVVSKLDWIEQQQVKLQKRCIFHDQEYVTGDVICLWGNQYHLILRETATRAKISCEDNHILLYIKKDSTKEQREKLINTLYRESLQQKIPELMIKWEQIIGVKSNSFQIRDMKTRWGTCNTRSRNITLNLQLAKKAPRCLEYVVVHELVHLLERSHNSVFKGYMNKLLPKWREIKKELNGID
jgi:predicted metal-dependent hydrolase